MGSQTGCARGHGVPLMHNAAVPTDDERPLTVSDHESTAHAPVPATEGSARPSLELAASPQSEERALRTRLLPAWLRAHFAAWGLVWIAFAATRFGVLVVGVLAEYAARNRGIEDVLPFAQAGTYIHYAGVISEGYTLENATEFPLLPALMYGLQQGTGMSLAVAGLLISNLCFLVGLIGFAKLGERYVGHDASVRASIYLAIWPVSHFFSLASTESLMLAGLVTAVLLALRGTTAGWLGAAVAALLCALTRPPGVLVGIPLLLIAIGQLRSGELRGRRIPAAIAAGAAIPAGVLGFFFYLQMKTGDFKASLHAQEQFNRHLSLDGPWRAVSGAVEAVRGGSLGEGFELAAAFLVTAMVIVFAARAAGDRWEVRGWVLFGAASVLMPLATGLVWQMPRFALLVPPLFWMLGVLGRRQWVHVAALILLPMALAFRVMFEVVGVTQ